MAPRFFIYHRFAERGLPSTNIRIEQFEAHLAEIETGGYHVLPLLDIIASFERGESLPDRAVAITIDDAFLSVYTEAWPRLKAAGLPFTLFVATDPVDNRTPGYMTWDHLRELVAGGVTIGHHTLSHRRMHENSREQNEAEIRAANARFAAELGITRSCSPIPSVNTPSPTGRPSLRPGFAPRSGSTRV